MRAPNSPAALNPLEERILNAVPFDAKHVAVIGDGDGRLARAISARTNRETKLFLSEPRQVLHQYRSDLPASGSSPWDISLMAQAAQKDGQFDFVVLYGLHEYWRGNLSQVCELLDLIRPDGRCWVTFVNSSALSLLQHQVPPIQIGPDSLAGWERNWPRLDYMSWLAFSATLETRCDAVWALLDEKSYDYCQKQGAPGGVSWDFKGIRVQANSAPEVVQWGATYVGIQMAVRPSAVVGTPQIEFSGVSFDHGLFQALVEPFPEAAAEDGDLLIAHHEIRRLRMGTDQIESGSVMAFLLEVIDRRDEPLEILLLGAGWGREVLRLRQARPKWKIQGVETSERLRRAGASLSQLDADPIHAFVLGKELPFPDKSFDLVLTLGFMSRLYEKAAAGAVAEVLRVARKEIFHLEDSKGPAHSLKLKHYNLGGVYSHFGRSLDSRPILFDGRDTGFVFHRALL